MKVATLIALCVSSLSAGSLVMKNHTSCVWHRQYVYDRKMDKFLFPQELQPQSEETAIIAPKTSLFDSGLGAEGFVEYRVVCGNQTAAMLRVNCKAVDVNDVVLTQVEKHFSTNNNQLIAVPDSDFIGHIKDNSVVLVIQDQQVSQEPAAPVENASSES